MCGKAMTTLVCLILLSALCLPLFGRGTENPSFDIATIYACNEPVLFPDISLHIPSASPPAGFVQRVTTSLYQVDAEGNKIDRVIYIDRCVDDHEGILLNAGFYRVTIIDTRITTFWVATVPKIPAESLHPWHARSLENHPLYTRSIHQEQRDIFYIQVLCEQDDS